MADYQIECYGVFKRLTQVDSLKITMGAEEVQIKELLDELQKQYPEMTDTLKVTACAIGDELLSRESTITPDKTLALIPPVSGGQ